MGDEERQAEDQDVDPAEQRLRHDHDDHDRHHAEEEPAQCDGEQRVPRPSRAPLEGDRGGKEVEQADGQAERRAGSSVDTPDQAGDEHDRRGDQQPVTDEIDGDPLLYRGRRVHGLPSSSSSTFSLYRYTVRRQTPTNPNSESTTMSTGAVPSQRSSS